MFIIVPQMYKSLIIKDVEHFIKCLFDIYIFYYVIDSDYICPDPLYSPAPFTSLYLHWLNHPRAYRCGAAIHLSMGS